MIVQRGHALTLLPNEIELDSRIDGAPFQRPLFVAYRPEAQPLAAPEIDPVLSSAATAAATAVQRLRSLVSGVRIHSKRHQAVIDQRDRRAVVGQVSGAVAFRCITAWRMKRWASPVAFALGALHPKSSGSVHVAAQGRFALWTTKKPHEAAGFADIKIQVGKNPLTYRQELRGTL